MSKLLVDEISDADNTGPVTVTDGLTVQGAFTSLGIDDNATSTAMTLDSSGNVLVGKTTTAFGTAGVEARSGGTLWATANGTNAASFNRLSSDGAIAYFSKDSTTVGSIGTFNDYMTVGSGDTGLLMYNGGDVIRPHNMSSNTARDNAIDLGSTSDRFKDLYLSGGVYLGGTGAANHLDDYEEGVFLPFTGIGSGYTGEVLENAQYTKIGRMVYINLRMKWTGTDGVGNPAVFIMPFTHATATATGTTGAIMYSGTQLRSGAALIAHMATNSNELYIYSGAGGAFSALTRAEFNGAYDLAISFCYYVA